MREFKFRAWDDDEKKMFYGVGVTPWNVILFEDVGGKMIVPQEIGTIGIDRDEISLEQFTGLKDKNGVEIYEGDILKQAGIVFWNQNESEGPGWGCIDVQWNDRCLEHRMIYLTTPLEIIGNIHENPEMAKGCLK